LKIKNIKLNINFLATQSFVNKRRMKKLFSVLLTGLLFFVFDNIAFSQVSTIPVGAGPYASLNAAFAAINAGGVYQGADVVVNINASYTQTDSAALNGGVFNSCLIKPTAPVTITANIGDGIFPRAIIVLDGADNVTVDGRIGSIGSTISLTLNNSNTTINAGSIKMQNGATNNVVRYVQCIGTGVGNSVGGRTISIGSSSATLGGNNNNIIERNLVIGGRRGIQTFGTGGASGATNNGTIIRNNVIKNASSIGIFAGSETRDNVVDSNEVFMNPATVSTDPVSGFRAINCQAVGTTYITKNRIHDLTSTDLATPYFGIIIFPASLTSPGSSVSTINVINNCVTLMTDNDGGVEGIYVSFIPQIPYTVNIFNNTIRLGGNASSGVGIFTDALNFAAASNGDTVNVFNNIAINGKTGGEPSQSRHLALNLLVFPGTGVILNSDYNLGKGLEPALGWDAGYDGFLYRNDEEETGLLEYRAAACGASVEQNSVFKNLVFVGGVNSCILDLNGGDLCGKSLTLVPVDLYNTPRDSGYPYKGCYEGPALKILKLTACLEGKVARGEVNVTLKNAACDDAGGRKCFGYLDIATNTSFLCFDNLVLNGVGYYAGVSSINHVETYSALPDIIFSPGPRPNGSFDFTTAQGKAFGSNQTQGPPACMFGGDVNRDGTIDLTDLSLIDNDGFNFVSGCNRNTDVNSDGTVDISDAAIADNNSFSFVSEILPCPDLKKISSHVVTSSKTEVLTKGMNISKTENN
jgi:Dockerin type I domain